MSTQQMKSFLPPSRLSEEEIDWCSWILHESAASRSFLKNVAAFSRHKCLQNGELTSVQRITSENPLIAGTGTVIIPILCASQLLHMGREYPLGYDYFRSRLKNAFLKNRDVTDPGEVEKLIARGEYVVKELEALYMLKKYRTMKRRYYEQ